MEGPTKDAIIFVHVAYDAIKPRACQILSTWVMQVVAWCKRGTGKEEASVKQFTSSCWPPPQLSVQMNKNCNFRHRHIWTTYLRSPRLPLTLVASIGPLGTESAVRLELTLLLSDLAGSFVDVGVGESDLRAGGLSLEIITLQINEV